MSAAENYGKPDLRVQRGGKLEQALPDRLPPSQVEFEQAVLAAAMMRSEVAQRLRSLVDSSDFYLAGHRFIYAAILDLVEQRKPVDILTVPQHLRQADMLERCGGMAYFTALADAIPTAAHVEYYAEKVRKAGEQRELIAYSDTLRAMADEDQTDPLEIIAKAEERLHELRRRAMRGQKSQAPMTYAELMAADLPEPVYLIDKTFPQGCILFHSVPKEGKTRLLTELAISATTGGKLFGVFEVMQIGFLCLFLEDSQPETQQRFKTLTEQGPKPANLHVAWDWETLDRGGLERLDQFFAEHPEVKGLIVDTLEYIRPPIQKDGQLYSQDVAALRKLKDLADKHQAFIIILHHSNKSKEHSDDVILSAGGTNGIAGSCDTIMQLQGKPDGTKVFRGKGRRIPPFAYVVKMDERAGYQYLGEAETVHRSGEEQELLEVLAASQWAMKETEIAQELGAKRESIRSRCRRAADRKLVKRTGPAQWEITPEGRFAFLEITEGNISGDRADRPDRPRQANQGGPGDRGDRIEEEAPLPEPPGCPGQDGEAGLNGRGGQPGQGGHLFSTPQTPTLFTDDPNLPDGLSTKEEEDRVEAWAVALSLCFPWEASIGEGEAKWRKWVERPEPEPSETEIVLSWLRMKKARDAQ